MKKYCSACGRTGADLKDNKLKKRWNTMNETEHKTNYIQIQNLIVQLRMQIKLLSDDANLVKRAIEKLKELEDLFITEEK